MVDPLRLRSLLDRLWSEVDGVRRILDGELDPEGDLLAALKYRVVVALEICVDMAQHIIASEGLRAPEGYGDSIKVLGEAGIIASDLAEDLGRAARLRNLLVHQYADVDDARLIAETRAGLANLEELARTLAGHFTLRPGEPTQD